jgi:hypothetical protein
VVPDFSTLSSRQKTLAVNIPYRGSKGTLHMLIDKTGIKVEGKGEWHARKHGGPKRRVSRKIYRGIDEQTLETRAVEITGRHIGDVPVLPDLLGQIPSHEQIGSVTADGAYATVNTTTPSLTAVLMLSSRPARTGTRGRPSPPEPWPETRPCAR